MQTTIAPNKLVALAFSLGPSGVTGCSGSLMGQKGISASLGSFPRSIACLLELLNSHYTAAYIDSFS